MRNHVERIDAAKGGKQAGFFYSRNRQSTNTLKFFEGYVIQDAADGYSNLIAHNALR